MKCIDPWLLNNRRQCPVCKRYVFPNNDNSDERTPTEQTPLMNSNDNDSVTEISRNRPLPGKIKLIKIKNLIFFFRTSIT
jgi:hypothetical protein